MRFVPIRPTMILCTMIALSALGCGGGPATSLAAKSRLTANAASGDAFPVCESPRAVRPSPYACHLEGSQACFEEAGERFVSEVESRGLEAATRTFMNRCGPSDVLACLAAGAVFSEPEAEMYDPARAASLFSRACQAGLAEGCFLMVAAAAETDLGAARPPLARACRGGSWIACAILGGFLTEEEPYDDVRARALFESSCACGEAEGCMGLAELLVDGRGGLERDVARAAELLATACDAGHGWSCAYLAELHVYGTIEPADLAVAFRAAERGCELGEGDACVTLGWMYVEGEGVAVDRETGVRLAERACELGAPDGCANLGAYLEVGLIVPQDAVRARQLYTRACREDSARGCYNLAIALRDGVGGQRDAGMAEGLLDRACELGEATACR